MSTTEELIGRSAESEKLRSFLAGDDHAAALLITGEAGIGKTALWDLALAQVEERALPMLSSRPLATDATLSFTGLADLLEDRVEEVADELPQPQARALRIALHQEEARGTAVEPEAIGAAIRSAIALLASSGPLVIAIDDLQWLDPESASTLAHAMRRLLHLPVRVLATVRTPAPESELGLGLPRERVERLELRALSGDELHALVALELGRPVRMPVIRKVEELSAGNPLFALELCRAAAGQQDPEAALTAPRHADLTRLVGERLTSLEPRTVDALATIAALPRRDLAAVAASLEDEASLEAAFEAGVLDERDGELRFAHPLLAAAAYESLSPSRRRRLHARLAELTADPEQRAMHLGSAASAPEAAAAAALEEGAGAAAGRGAPAAAAGMLERAAALTPGDETRAARLQIAAAAQHARAGDGGRAVEMWREVVARLEPGPLRAEALALMAESERVPGVEGAEMGRRAVAECGDDDELRVRCLASLVNALMVLNEWSQARVAAGEALSIARRLGRPELLVPALQAAGFVDGCRTPGAGRDLLREAIAIGDERLVTTQYLSPTTSLGCAHLWADELDDARELLELSYGRAVDVGEEGGKALLEVHLTELEVRAGDLAAARRYADDCLSLRDEGEPDQGLLAGLYARALVAAHAGDEPLTRSLCQRGQALGKLIEDELFPDQLLCVLGFLELSLGDSSAAFAAVGAVPRRLREVGYGEPGFFLCHAEAIEALIGEARLDEASAQLEAWQALAERHDRPRAFATAARARGLLLGSGGDFDGALAAFEEALRHHERLPVPIELARTQLARGALLRRAGRRRDARAALEDALRSFDLIGSTLWAERAREELDRISGRAPNRGDLTSTERRVAELVADGRTNREVAARLFVSVRTVEANLTRIYAKLDIRSRTELAGRWGESATNAE